MTTQTIAGIAIPDTQLVRDTTDYIREVEDDLLFDHSRRVFLFGALQGQRRGLNPDLELLYVGAMFHDIGLTQFYRNSMLRFEVDGANAAEKFLREHGYDDATVRKVWLSIALHTTPGVPEFLDPEIALVTAAVFPTNPIGTPETVSSTIHLIAGGVVFAVLATRSLANLVPAALFLLAGLLHLALTLARRPTMAPSTVD